mgnify:CR=1 FL=1
MIIGVINAGLQGPVRCPNCRALLAESLVEGKLTVSCRRCKDRVTIDRRKKAVLG